MGISRITSTNSMSVTPISAVDLKDQKSKNIQNEITDVQQQMQKLSSKETLSVNEKTNERKKLQREISSLNTELKQHEEELLRSQKRERTLAELRENTVPAKEEEAKDKIQSKEPSSTITEQKNPLSDGQQHQTAQPGSVITQNSDGTVILKEILNQNTTSAIDPKNQQTDETKEETVDKEEEESSHDDAVTDANPSVEKMHAIADADAFLQQANRVGAIVAKTSDGIAILKGEINQDNLRDADANTERKQAELEKMEKQEQRAIAFQSSILGEANNAIKPATETNVTAQNNAQSDAEANAYISALNMSLEEQTSQPKFFVSFG